MKESLLKETQIKEKQLELMKVGYIREIKDIGARLLTSTVKESYELNKRLCELVEAYKRAEAELKDSIEAYQAEALKGVKGVAV